MKLNIEWSSKLEVFDAVGTIETLSSDRKDILEILKYIDTNGIDRIGMKGLFGNKDISSIVIERVIEYLSDCGYINNTSLSKKGKKIIATEKVPVEQRGKFRFYNIENSGFMDNIYENGKKLIIAYNRQKDTGSKYIHRENIENYKKLHVKMPNSEEEFKIINLSDNNKNGGNFACVKQSNLGRDIKLNMELESTNKLKLTVNGKFGEIGEGYVRKENNVVFSEQVVDKELSYYIIDIIEQCDFIENYDNNKKSFKLLDIGKLISQNILRTKDLGKFNCKFNLKNVLFSENKYDIKASNIPIMPNNKMDALKWIDTIVEEKIKEKYTSNDELEGMISEIVSRPEIQDYIYDGEITKDIYIKKFKENSERRVYWNIQAPSDLSYSNNNADLIIDRLDISRDTNMSIISLINKLVGDRFVEKIVFSSKYIRNEEQQKKFNIFIEAMKEKGCKDVTLVTEYKIKINDIVVKTYEEIFGRRRNWPHDRYFSLYIDGQWQCYKMSAELDQCKFYEDFNQWNFNTVGVWKDISFNRIDRSIFPQELLMSGNM